MDDSQAGKQKAFDVEIYTPERKAEFLLNNSITKEDYDGSCEAVRELGLDPAKIPFTDPDIRDQLPTNEEMAAIWAKINTNFRAGKQVRRRNA